MLRDSPHGDPLETVLEEGGPFHAKGNLSCYCEWLGNTDRAWAIPLLRERHPQEPAR